MSDITFITGNQGKADFLAKWLGHEVAHHKLDLDELQSLDVHVIAEHKARQAYELLKTPVLVEDAYLRCTALGRLPGPYIKWFIDELGCEGVCKLLNGFADRSAFAGVCYAFCDGKDVLFFEGELAGTISPEPRGDGGFGFDPIFIPNNQDAAALLTFSEMSEAQLGKYAIRTSQVFPKLRDFLAQRNP